MAGLTQVPILSTCLFAYGAFTLCRPTFQKVPLKLVDVLTGPTTPEIKSLVWALPTSLAATMGISDRFLFLCLLRCVTSAGIALLPYEFGQQLWDITPTGFPHSEISGSKLLSSSPELIAGLRVLHRLSIPRHPPTALSNLIKNL